MEFFMDQVHQKVIHCRKSLHKQSSPSDFGKKFEMLHQCSGFSQKIVFLKKGFRINTLRHQNFVFPKGNSLRLEGPKFNIRTFFWKRQSILWRKIWIPARAHRTQVLQSRNATYRHVFRGMDFGPWDLGENFQIPKTLSHPPTPTYNINHVWSSHLSCIYTMKD